MLIRERPSVLIDSGGMYANSIRKITSVLISINALREISEFFVIMWPYQAKILHAIRSFFCEKFPSLLYLLAFFPDSLKSWPQVYLSLQSTCKVSQKCHRKCHRSIRGKGTVTKPNLSLWEACKFPQRNRRTEKCREFLPQKFNGPRLGIYPGQGVLLYVGHMGMYFCSPKEYGFQLNLFCKTIIRLSPPFRRKHSAFPPNFVTGPHSSHRNQWQSLKT